VAIVAVAAATAIAVPNLDSGGSHSAPRRAGAASQGVAQAASPPAYPATDRAPVRLSLAAVPEPIAMRFRHEPSAGLLFDLDSGRVLWRRNPTQPLPIASLTKMMTALLVVEHAKPAEQVLITKEALAYQGSGVGVLPRGKRVALETLMYGLLLPSGNDAAIALAQHVAGNVPAFVSMMNARAARMGLKCTHFASPDGLDNGNRSCAADLAVLARADLDQPRIARIVGARAAVLPFPIKGGKLFLYNNNPLLRVPFAGITGLKTGETSLAGVCLVETATRGRARLGAIVLHSTPLDAAKQVRALLTRGFTFETRGR
jgi:serine-type D-Ala-D-Ala carboxypeptidase (penicillin-binding protein 5/6)